MEEEKKSIKNEKARDLYDEWIDDLEDIDRVEFTQSKRRKLSGFMRGTRKRWQRELDNRFAEINRLKSINNKLKERIEELENPETE